MKKILAVLIFGLFTIFSMSAFSVRAYKDVDWKNFEVTSKAEEITDDAALTMYNAISYSSDITVKLLNDGYYNIQLDKDYWGIWMMILADGEWFSINYIYNPNNKYVGCYLTKYKLKV